MEWVVEPRSQIDIGLRECSPSFRKPDSPGARDSQNAPSGPAARTQLFGEFYSAVVFLNEYDEQKTPQSEGDRQPLGLPSQFSDPCDAALWCEWNQVWSNETICPPLFTEGRGNSGKAGRPELSTMPPDLSTAIEI